MSPAPLHEGRALSRRAKPVPQVLLVSLLRDLSMWAASFAAAHGFTEFLPPIGTPVISPWRWRATLLPTLFCRPAPPDVRRAAFHTTSLTRHNTLRWIAIALGLVALGRFLGIGL